MVWTSFKDRVKMCSQKVLDFKAGEEKNKDDQR